MIPSATVIEYLDDHAGAFTALLTAALILVTTYYAVQNRRMVKEMARTRELSILPKLALEFHRLGPTAMTVAVVNVGPGAALAIDVRMIYEPSDEGGHDEERRWWQNVLASGERRDFMPPGELNGNLNTLTATYRAIRLVGTMKDAAGKTHVIDEAFAELSEWREVLGGAHQRFVAADPERRLAEELAKKFDKPTSALTAQLSNIAGAIGRITPPDRDETDGDR